MEILTVTIQQTLVYSCDKTHGCSRRQRHLRGPQPWSFGFQVLAKHLATFPFLDLHHWHHFKCIYLFVSRFMRTTLHELEFFFFWISFTLWWCSYTAPVSWPGLVSWVCCCHMTTQAGAASSGGQPGPSLWSGEPASRLKRIMVWEKHTIRVQIEK